MVNCVGESEIVKLWKSTTDVPVEGGTLAGEQYDIYSVIHVSLWKGEMEMDKMKKEEMHFVRIAPTIF